MGKAANVNIGEFLERFNANYTFLYDNGDNVAGYGEAVDAFDRFVSSHGDLVGEFAAYRGDLVSSDRDAAAFMFALSEVGRC